MDVNNRTATRQTKSVFWFFFEEVTLLQAGGVETASETRQNRIFKGK